MPPCEAWSQELRKELTFLLDRHVAGAATAPVAIVRLFEGAEFLSQLNYCSTRTTNDLSGDAVRDVEKAGDQIRLEPF